MVSRRSNPGKTSPRRHPPATTPDARENQMISLAVDLAERQLANGTASAQVISHYLKLGSSRERLEQERLGKENELLDVKRQAIASAQRVEELYRTALDAMRSYAGQDPLAITETYDDQDLSGA